VLLTRALTTTHARQHDTIRASRSPAVSRHEGGSWEKLPTAVRIVHSVIGNVDGTSIQLPLWQNVGRDATRDLGPHRLARGVVWLQRRRLPYRRKVGNILRHGWIKVPRAFEIGV
jgi:hypothetical protein